MEMLIVAAVILVITAIAVPNMLRARMKANESAAVANMRTINTAESMYASTYPDVGYAGRLADLGSHGSTCESRSETNACLLMDDSLTGGLKSGYAFDLMSDGQKPAQGYTLTARPVVTGTTGRCAFTSDQSGVISIDVPGADGHTRFAMAGNTCDH